MSTTITPANLNEHRYKMPVSLVAEIKRCFEWGREEAVEHCIFVDESQGPEPQHFCYFPRSGRGCAGYASNLEWTDCDGLNDLIDRYENYETRWCN